MSISSVQKLAVVSCVALCVALLLPKMLLSRAKRDGEGASSILFIDTACIPFK